EEMAVFLALLHLVLGLDRQHVAADLDVEVGGHEAGGIRADQDLFIAILHVHSPVLGCKRRRPGAEEAVKEIVEFAAQLQEWIGPAQQRAAAPRFPARRNEAKHGAPPFLCVVAVLSIELGSKQRAEIAAQGQPQICSSGKFKKTKRLCS